ncbi:TIGR03756 family integrating conjugative element protein [Phocoenobacter skyensis]|uniref:TIGR03756 family integrating conjugative element protein n=1 Tax=Phocoenobacter skyensis TaxID=97481 RepID=UPI0027631995|nr:TIGR03756 family integrating conjugative element protein [Pasteurella skyensis]MDP8185344.1 TIGR03756 family integrating conjugative element protein [Pasteurella skyensis]
MNKTLIKSIVCSVPFIFSESIYGSSDSINTAQIMASSGSTDCLDYRVSGICFWLYCTPWGCSIRTSVKVSHFQPEMVVSVYNHKKQNPWKEMNFMSKGKDGGGNRSKESEAVKYSQLTFKNATAIGHPEGLISKMLAKTGYYCSSQTTSFTPYFLSELDKLAWTKYIPEMAYPEALVPGMREISKNSDTWGNVFPRGGFVTQKDAYKASAVVAQRVANIVSKNWQPHIYIPAAKRNSDGRWYPGEVKENDKKTHKWQQLFPKTLKSCDIFPDSPPQLSTKGNYAWALWRPYSCCKRKGQVFLYSIDFNQ